MNKEDIFDNLPEFTAQDLFKYIRQGVVTLPELKDPHNVDEPMKASVRKELEDLLENAEPNDWAAALNEDSISAYQKYLDDYREGVHRQEARNAISRLKTQSAKKEADIRKSEDKILFDGINKKDKKALQDFIDKYKDNAYVDEAKKILNELENRDYIHYGMDALKEDILATQTDKSINDPNKQILELIESAFTDGTIDIDDLLDEIEDDNNFLNAWVIKELVKKQRLNYRDLEDIGIKPEFIQKLAGNVQRTRFDVPESISEISRKETTEVYFWGIPSSGKSCALGAILSVAGNGQVAKTMTLDSDCQGFDYMNRLPQCFLSNGTVCVLPEGTPTMSTYEMGFDLTDQKGLVHPITCIDFAGELIKCMYKTFAKKPLTNQEKSALDTLTNILISNRTSSRKIHFFVVEYGAENRQYEGLPQINYLKATLNYINSLKDNNGNSIFKTSTDAIYLVVTKVDKLKAYKGQNKSALLSEHVIDHYGDFYNGLKQICEANQINGGKVSVLPFSLGKVCFQNYCKFNTAYAESIVNLIMERSDGYRIGKRGLLESLLRG